MPFSPANVAATTWYFALIGAASPRTVFHVERAFCDSLTQLRSGDPVEHFPSAVILLYAVGERAPPSARRRASHDHAAALTGASRRASTVRWHDR
jgi:hypothetical protein